MLRNVGDGHTTTQTLAWTVAYSDSFGELVDFRILSCAMGLETNPIVIRLSLIFAN